MDPSFDIKRARQDTPACEEIIHFNNAGASLMPVPVSDVLHDYLHSEERIGGYETAGLYNETLEQLYQSASRLLNCSSDEVAFVESATRAWQLAFYSFDFRPGGKILTTLSEYGSNVIAYIQQARRYGVELVFVPDDEYGQIDINALQNLIDGNVKLISITHIPTGGGLVNPAKEIGSIARSSAIPYILDSCQGVGQIPIDVEEIGCDVLCITGRKYLRGPRATGLLYMGKELMNKLEPSVLDQHGAVLTSPGEYEVLHNARRFENWEQYLAGKMALCKAIDYSLSWGLETIQQRVYALADTLRCKLSDIDGISVKDEGREKCGIVTFIAENSSPVKIKEFLAGHRINVSTSKGSGNLVSFQSRGLKEVVRASVHYYNNDAEIDYFIDMIRKI